MARRKQNLFEVLIEATSKLTWWMGVALAMVVYVWLHSVAVSEVTASQNKVELIRQTAL